MATTAAFSISRLRVKGGRLVMNLALFTYFIPAYDRRLPRLVKEAAGSD